MRQSIFLFIPFLSTEWFGIKGQQLPTNRPQQQIMPKNIILTSFKTQITINIWRIHVKAVPLHSQTSRGGAVVARWAHNPKVTGSSPVPATTKPETSIEVSGFSFGLTGFPRRGLAARQNLLRIKAVWIQQKIEEPKN